MKNMDRNVDRSYFTEKSYDLDSLMVWLKIFILINFQKSGV
jgi:hypothetical protein